MKLKRRLIALAVCAACNELAAQPVPLQGDFGGVGLMQTPTARMMGEGNVSFGFSKVEPYGRLYLALQPFEWFEGVFRYTDVDTVAYAVDVTGKQSTKDKGFDFKVRVWEESRWLPQVAVGLRDIGGNSLFSGEYVVASKRWNDLDFSLGMGWGYLAKRGDIENPLGWLHDGFNTRPNGGGGQGGTVALSSFFRGPAALFGGVQWQTPWEPLQLKLEYEGNNYRNDYGGPTVKQDSALNYGASYRLNDALTFHAGWERGNTMMIGVTLQGDFSPRSVSPRKVSDPPAEPVRATDARPDGPANWPDIAQRLEKSAGFRVDRIKQRERELVVEGEQRRYRPGPTGLGRAARVLDKAAGPDVDWLTVAEKRDGMPLVETSVNRESFRDAVRDEAPLSAVQRTIEHAEPLPRQETTLYEAPPADPLTWGTSLGYRQNLGGPDGFILYQFNANLEAEYRLAPGTWIDGRLSANLLNNYDKFVYTAPSNLPRVRTLVREYLVSSDITMPVLQATHARRLEPEVYGMVYAGYLETMFAGVGGEMLYRPLNSPLAVGFNANWVKQRGFNQDFALRDYDVFTGHVSAYYRDLLPGTLLTLSAGRYLAGDWGGTVDIAREFSNGVRMGVWATQTNVSREQFGEGSFDKGFYLSVPFDVMGTRSTRDRANLVIQPLIRDGGARLQRERTLYDMTEERDSRFLHQNFPQIRD